MRLANCVITVPLQTSNLPFSKESFSNIGSQLWLGFFVTRSLVFIWIPKRSGTSTLGTLRYEDGKARTGTAVDAGNFRGSRRVAKNKMLKVCIFAKDGDFKNSNFQNAILRSNDIL